MLGTEAFNGDTRMTLGHVHLVGAGPGDPELLTLKALRLIEAADVVLFDRLVGDGVMALVPPQVERVFVGKRRANHHMRQVEIQELMVRRARRGQSVVRLKGGDPMVFGRGGEEIEALVEAGVPFTVVPGITAACGIAAEYAIPLTHRHHAQSLTFVTGHLQNGEPYLDWPSLCRPGQTLVFYMGHTALAKLCLKLIEGGLRPDLPACLVENGTLPESRRVQGTLTTLPALIEGHTFQGPALVIVGEVVAQTEAVPVHASARVETG